MRIAQIAPLFEAVPPKLYGGSERVVSWITEELVAMGHDVTLFASGDSVTAAKLDAPWPRALRLDPTVLDWVATWNVMMEYVYQRKDQFDILHFHTDYFPNTLFSRQNVPFLTTLHGRLNLKELGAVYGMFPKVPLVSISNNQRLPLPGVNWLATVPHGLPANSLRPLSMAQEYFAFLGRISPEKGIERAIRIAGACGVKLKVAAKIDKADAAYFQSVIEPLLKTADVEFIGEIGDAQKSEFLSGAKALIFAIDWPEPFGLVMIEAMACGCPVIAMRHGSVPEVMEEGVTGYIVDTVEQAIEACGRLHLIDRTRVRAVFDRRFTSARMAQDYLRLYERLIADRQAWPLAR